MSGTTVGDVRANKGGVIHGKSPRQKSGRACIGASGGFFQVEGTANARAITHAGTARPLVRCSVIDTTNERTP